MAPYCQHCDRPLVPLDVPPPLREFAPGASAVVGSCPRCLRTSAVAAETADAVESDDATLPEAVPDGDGRVAVALVLGHLDSLATNRAAIEAFVEHAERGGADVFLTLDRLAADDAVDPHAELARRRRQLESLLDY
ncbi:DUF6276 family protein [Halobellus clavatus]|jgi:hypothetical protein|uniref:Small CPxCG-related zinc finger protein n=1 Tax=Halobellus clavatus TaxID=660517 RepID=A0A1H3JE96_9EURY|nr:DUF6276 family protein [Halobellus clavatus]SDY38231.1 hypothetical protein SAMN04487946_11343 [Halobellus clavatus]